MMTTMMMILMLIIINGHIFCTNVILESLELTHSKSENISHALPWEAVEWFMSMILEPD